MDKNLLEQRLREQSLVESLAEFRGMVEKIRSHPIMSEIYKYARSEFILDKRRVTFLEGMTTENVEASITARAETIYKLKVDDLLKKMTGLQDLFEW